MIVPFMYLEQLVVSDEIIQVIVTIVCYWRKEVSIN